VRKHGASTASRRAAPPSTRFQRDRPEVGGVTHIVVVYDICSVLVWRRSDTLCISGFVDDVVFAHWLIGCSTSPPG